MCRLAITLGLLLLSCCMLIASARAQNPEQQSTLTAEQYTQEGNAYAKEKQYDKAVDSFRLAIKLNPNLATAYFGLGSAYASMGRLSDALEPMRIAVRLDPGNPLAHLNLGRALASFRRFDDGLAEMNEAKRLSPDNAY